MKRLTCVLLAALMLFAGCGAAEPAPGEELILAARKWYCSLDSARVDVVNDETGEHEQVFVYKYDEKGIMTYSYIGTGEGIHLAQYNNGREQFTDDNGSVTALDASDIRFTAYSRDVPYPMADEGLILFYKSAVIPEESEVTSGGGVTLVRHKYDVSKLGQYEGEGRLADFEVSYRFAEDGSLIDFTEVTTVELDGGNTVRHSYTIYISGCNEVERVENPVDIGGISD